jgi:hypothetical protein
MSWPMPRSSPKPSAPRREALEALFGPESGFASCESYYEFPTAIVSRELYLSAYGHSYLNVCCVAVKGEKQAA